MYKGTYDPGTEWDLPEMRGRPQEEIDAEIARRLQVAEENPYLEHIEDRRPATYESEAAVRAWEPQVEAWKEDREEEVREERDYAQEEARRAREEIKREKAALDRERRERQTAERKLREAVRKPARVEYTPFVSVRKMYDVPTSYVKWYDYIPSWYGPLERRRAQSLIARLLDKEKLLSDYELEEKVKKLIEEADKKKPAARKSPRRRSPRRKSPRRSPRKKSPKRKKSPRRK